MLLPPGANPIRRPLPPIPGTHGTPPPATTQAGATPHQPGPSNATAQRPPTPSQPAPAPARPPTPGHAWAGRDLSAEDQKAKAFYDGIRSNYAQNPAWNPTRPAGLGQMPPEMAAAAHHFRAEYRASMDFAEALDRKQGGTYWQDLSKGGEFAQTYRNEGGSIVPNREHLHFTQGHKSDTPEGFFPNGTKVHIHSHPEDFGANGNFPSPADHGMAFQQRTNALHGPDTNIPFTLLYHPQSDKFFATNGALDKDGKPHFLEAVNPYNLLPPRQIDGKIGPVSIPNP